MLATVGNIFHCPTFDFPTIDILNEIYAIFYEKFDFLNISIVLIWRKNQTVNGFKCIIYINCFSFSFSIYITVKWCSNKVVIPLMIMKISFLVFFCKISNAYNEVYFSSLHSIHPKNLQNAIFAVLPKPFLVTV